MRETGFTTEKRERVLEVAERLFAQRGYASVTLRDIASEIGIRHASLYHHVPGGKQELFIEVTERTLTRHREGLTHAIAHADRDIRSQLRAAARWLLSQPPMDLIRMVYSDMPVIEQRHAERLSLMAYEALLGPIEYALVEAQARGEIQHDDLALVAGGALGMIEAMYSVPQNVLDNETQTREELAYKLIDVLLNGLRPRHS
jgi:TetR/AcrR family transcriptional regulator, cholesterol catabolism regulator